MALYGIAGLKVNIDFKYDLARNRAEAYFLAPQNAENADIYIKAEQQDFEDYIKMFGRSDCLDEFEYVILSNKFSRKVLRFSALMLHSSCVVVDNKAYLFSADSGTGKSTHTENYLKAFGSRAYILNDDKPIIRAEENGIFAYGTPFSGKHEIHKNAKAEIGGICFLFRGEKNQIEPIAPSVSLPLFLKQTVTKVEKSELESLLSLTDRILTSLPTYMLYCNTDISSAIVSFEGMRRAEG